MAADLWDRLQGQFGDAVVLNGHPTERLPNTLNVSFQNQKGYELLPRLDGIAASTGSACHAGTTSISPVLAAMRLQPDVALGAVRFSLGRSTSEEDLEYLVERLKDVLT
jgi:cysteine desulfurase